MKMTAAFAEKLMRLSKGEALPSSSLKGKWITRMLSDGILVVSTKGSRKSYRACDEQSFTNYLAACLDIRDLEAYRSLLLKDEASRACQVKVTGNSKTRPRRTFRGFLVNCYSPVPITINGKSTTLLPPEGTFVFIYDYKTLAVPDDIIVVGVENAENFRYIREQKRLFESCFPKGAQLLFVSRYPQGQSRDLMDWLLGIPNQYIHFGDLDLAGVHIFLSEYYKYLGERASFLIPKDYRQRLSAGSRERYEAQYAKFRKMEMADDRLRPLVECIHQYHRGYDQEGFIGE